jgi:dihydroorotase
MSADFDLLIHAGRIVCPASRLDTTGAIAIRGDRIAAVVADATVTARRVLHFPDDVLLPGLIDLHAHPCRAGSQFGVDPDSQLLARGTTTALSQGDAGAANVDAFVRDTIESSQMHVVLAINLSSLGEQGPGGCFELPHSIDVAACVAAVERNRPQVWGIAVNASHHACGRTDPREVLRQGLAAAEQTGLPILYGMRRTEDWPLDEQLRCLRPGDVVTYCFRSRPHCLMNGGHVRPEFREARERGILFDIGHGRSSFHFETAAAAIQDEFLPDTVSTDVQRGHIGYQPIHDLPLVMSKLSAAGMSERDIFAAVTTRPANVLRRSEQFGTLKTGSLADLTLLNWTDSTEPLADTDGNTRSGGRWHIAATIRAGQLIEPLELASVTAGS